MLEAVYKLSKLSIVRYTIAVVINVSISLSIHRYRSIDIAIHASVVRCIVTALVCMGIRWQITFSKIEFYAIYVSQRCNTG